ncbi:MAG: urease accessory protein UreE [Rhodobacteraceae bacterium]|nr:urease accessory protein UreE [Paracoccaceae bacterium]
MSETDAPADRLPRVLRLLPGGEAEDQVDLDHAARFLRRRRLVSRGGRAFLVDLPKATELADGAVLELENGVRIAVEAAPEPLLEIRGDLPRLAWHIGNRHTPCEIGADRLRIVRDHVLAEMLRGLGADLHETIAPFRPEGGAYGMGRTFGHEHGATDHTHDAVSSEDAPHHHGHAHESGPVPEPPARAESAPARDYGELRAGAAARRLNARFRDRHGHLED